MSQPIIGMQHWFQTPPGRYLLSWEQAALDAAVGDIFGYHALQLGLPEVDGLRANRMPHRWLGLREAPGEGATRRPHLVTDFAALPFESASLDLVVLPHSLEFDVDPHAALREVERVLVPEGKVVICGLNPLSLWGLRQRRARLWRRMGMGQLFLPEAGDFIGYRRLRDWLRLLSFEVEAGQFGCWRPALSTERWLGRFDWMDELGQLWWPIFGAVYFIVAVKRVRGPKLVGLPWKKPARLAASPVPVANRGRHARQTEDMAGKTCIPQERARP